MSAEDSPLSSSLVTFLRKHLNCPSLVVDLRSSWSAKSRNHRLAIRDALSLHLEEDLRDLTSWPRPRGYFVSISHCAVVGGYALTERSMAIGFDVEMSERVSAAIVARVTSEAEFVAAPSLPALWTAKEAGFKALSHLGEAELLTDVTIGDWRIGTPPLIAGASLSSFAEFRVSTLPTVGFSGAGVVMETEGVSIALFSKLPST